MEGGEGSPLLALPELEEASYIISLWHDAGTVGQGGMGITPLSWQEIRAWHEENELTLSNYEISCVRSLSQDYCGEYHAASDKARPAPYEVVDEQFDRVAVGSKIKNMLSGLKRNQEEPRYTVEQN